MENEGKEENNYEKNKNSGIRNDDGVIYDCMCGKGGDDG